MTKKQFLTTLHARLEGLKEEDVQKIIEEITNKLEEAKKAGVSYKDTIASFGNIDQFVEDLKRTHGLVDKKKSLMARFDQLLNFIVDEILSFCKDFSKLLETEKGIKILRIVFKVLVVLFFIWLLKLPFLLLDTLGKFVLMPLSTSFYRPLYNIWNFLIHFSYLLVAVVFLYVFIKRLVGEERPTVLESRPQKSQNSEKVVPAEKQNYAAMMFRPFLFLIQIVVVLLTLPLWVTFIALFITLIGAIVFCFQGFGFIGLIILLFGLLLLVGSILGIIYYFAFRRGRA